MSPEDAKRLQESVKWFNLSEELLPKEGLVLAAVSGGPDSMALLSMLHNLSSELRFRLAVGHFDHQIREGSDADGLLVEQYARKLAVPFYAGKADVPSQAAEGDDTLEEAARKARYRFLFELADKIGAARIATGHTRDDQVETVLMRILRGTGIRGLAGIPTRRGKVIRPLLCLSRQDTMAYCDNLEIPYTLDPTNADPAHFRNRIRHELLPRLKDDFHPGVDENLLRLAENARVVMQRIRTQTKPLIQQNLRKNSPGQWVLNVSKIASLDETSIFVLFGDIFAESLECDMDFARVHYEQLARLVKDSRGSGKQLSLPGLTVKREYENLLITQTKAAASVAPSWDYRATLTLPGETEVAGYRVRTEILDRDALADRPVRATDEVAYFALGELKLPLVLRSPEAGDRMQPFGMTGTKKLSDIFTDKKIPGRVRSQSLVVADADEILWLVGVTTSEKSRVASGTAKVVRISIAPDAGMKERQQ